MNSQVEAVNALLKAGEPGNISIDEHSGYTGYKPQAVIDAMNEVLWGQWAFEEVSSEVVPGDKGALAVAQVRVSLKDVLLQPVGWGQNRVTRGDIGDARKGAQTDAIKKALSYFSIGNRAYHGLLDAKAKPASNGAREQSSNGHTPAKPAQEQEQHSESFNTLVARARTRAYKLGIKGDQWIAYVTHVTGKQAEQALDIADVGKINGDLTAKEQPAREKQPA